MLYGFSLREFISILLADSPYDTRHERVKTNSVYNVFTSRDMVSFQEICSGFMTM